MSEMKCPCCGNDLDYYVSVVEGDDEPIWYECMSRSCMFSCNGPDLFRIAAALELARAAVWAGECEDQKDYMDDVTSNRDAWRSIVNLDLEANDGACKALERCEEVFGV